MSHICVVMAVYNRINNVRMALHSWSVQNRKDFSIVVADDGSDDDILGLVKTYKDLNIQYYRQRYANVAVMLNKGTRLADATHIWYTDGDIIRDKDAMEWAYKHIEEYPNRTIIGRYDWLPEMHFTEYMVEHKFAEITSVEGIRPDHRLSNDPDAFEHLLENHSGHILGANFIIPKQAWIDTGGWDEWLPGSNANDNDFGRALTAAGYGSLSCKHIGGFHQYHERDGKALAEGACIALITIFKKWGEPIPEYYQPWIEKEKQWRIDHGWGPGYD